jgi:hypothetical protein
MVSATHNAAPSMCTLAAGVIFIILGCPSGTVPTQAPILDTNSGKA